MNICLLTRSLPIHGSGGLESHTADLARGLAARGHTVHIITSAHPQGKQQETWSSVTIHHLKATRPGRYTPGFFRHMPRAVNALHVAQQLDIVHSQGFAGLTYRPPKGGPPAFVVTIHGTLFSETPLSAEQFPSYSASEKIARLWRYRQRIAISPLYANLLRRAQRIIVDSQFTRQELLKSSPKLEEKIRVVPLGVDENQHPLVDKGEARQRLGLSGFILLTIGRLEEMKGVQVVLEAMAQCPRRDFTYLIGGAGSKKDELEAFCAARQLTNVQFLGRVSEELLSSYYAAADLFIFPELGQPAFGLVAIEAMLQGTPVLASRTGAIPEVVTSDVGFLFERGNAEELAKRLQEILQSPDLVETRARRCREHVRSHFAFDRMVDRTIEVYGELLSLQ
jgi:glycosyltransferase involved in cell wall biosynthesis